MKQRPKKQEFQGTLRNLYKLNETPRNPQEPQEVLGTLWNAKLLGPLKTLRNLELKQKGFLRNLKNPKECSVMDHWLWIPQLFKKFQNAIFFQNIKNSFQGVTPMGLTPHQIFFQFLFFKKYGCYRSAKFLHTRRRH